MIVIINIFNFEFDEISKYTDKDLNALVAEDKKILAEANKLSEAGTNYGRVSEIEARRKEIKEILEAAQKIPESGYGNIKADLALEKQVSGIDELIDENYCGNYQYDAPGYIPDHEYGGIRNGKEWRCDSEGVDELNEFIDVTSDGGYIIFTDSDSKGSMGPNNFGLLMVKNP